MILKSKYNVELVNKGNAHYYRVNGEETSHPGVTTIQNCIEKIYLRQWYAKETAGYISRRLNLLLEDRSKAKKIIAHFNADPSRGPRSIERFCKRAKIQAHLKKEGAADIGTRAHRAIDRIIRGEDPLLERDILIPVASFVKWQKSSNIRIIQGDTKLINLDYCYGGSLDAIAEAPDGKLIIIDFKTSNQTSVEYASQISAYAMAMRFMYGLDYVPIGYCVRFDKKKEKPPEIRMVRDTISSFHLFQSALYMFNLLKLKHFDERLKI